MTVLLGVGHVVDVLGANAQDDVLAERLGRLALERCLEEPGIRDGLTRRADDLRREEVHRRRADEARDEEVRRALVEILRRIQLLEQAFVHHGDTVSHRHRLDLVVRDVDRGPTDPLVELLQLRARLDAELRVEVGERLVHQEDRRLPRDRASDGHALPLATGELFRLALQQLREAEQLADLVHATLDLGLGHPAELETERHVVVDAHVRIERVVLKDHRDVAVLRRDVVHQTLADEDVAARLIL